MALSVTHFCYARNWETVPLLSQSPESLSQLVVRASPTPVTAIVGAVGRRAMAGLERMQ
jgi:hypothetical protein